ncbi:Hypothetical predicted protein [Mytilus galloprovincialis]|uniref:Uncharacterized protein n=1 Tax=Mytilus galloprovincialis TaxID=29158 RepID=A0A8B6H0B8_MYTGA|nr:Hypothetical predicted protein [Mytilus galloprovincialis]
MTELRNTSSETVSPIEPSFHTVGMIRTFSLMRGNIEQPIETPSKRDCAGFPCMYTHLSAKAGRASLYRKLARLIDDCISDLNCNPGRRKRSITSALELLTVSQQS